MLSSCLASEAIISFLSVFKAAFVIRRLSVFIRSFNKCSPVTNISSSKFAVLGVKFYPCAHYVEPRTSVYLSYHLSPIICPSLSLSLSLSVLLSLLPSPAYLLITTLRALFVFQPFCVSFSVSIYLCAYVPLGCILLII